MFNRRGITFFKFKTMLAVQKVLYPNILMESLVEETKDAQQESELPGLTHSAVSRTLTTPVPFLELNQT